MNLRLIVSCGLVCAAIALTGCDDGRQTPASVGVRVVNVAPGFGELGFRREQNDDVTNITFKGAQEISYGADTYDFFVFQRALTSAASRSWTFSAELKEDHFYTFVLSEVAGEVEPIIMDITAAPENEAQVYAVHAGLGLPAMDLYLERPGVGIAGATPRATLNAQGTMAPRTLAGGDYEVWLTAAGDPSNVLLASGTITLPAGITSGLIVAAEGDQAAPEVSVVLAQPSSSLVYDRNEPGELRVVNGATDMAPRDFAVHSQFSPPLFANIPFGEPTSFAPIAIAQVPINVTPVGNPGVLELSGVFVPGPFVRSTLLFSGPAGTLTHLVATDDGRRIHDEAKLLFLNAATQFPSVDYIVVEPGFTDLANVIPIVTLAAPGSGFTYFPFAPGDYDLYLRQTGATTILSGPTRITLAAEGIYGVLGVNGPDTATASLRFFDDFP
jgi:hypothetical protein